MLVRERLFAAVIVVFPPAVSLSGRSDRNRQPGYVTAVSIARRARRWPSPDPTGGAAGGDAVARGYAAGRGRSHL